MTDKQKTAPEKKAVKHASEAAPAETKSKPAKAAKAEPVEASPPAKPVKVEAKPIKTEAKPVKIEAKPVKAEAKSEKPEAKVEKLATKPKQAEPEVQAEPSPAPAPAPVAPPVVMHGGIPAGPMRPLSPPRAPAKAENFVAGDHVVYPTHGVGKVDRIAVEEIAGHTLELICITFDENRMTLRVPTNKARTAGLRKLASKKQFDDVLAVLKGRARIKRTMWSRRAQEYEAKINSGDPAAIAEVVRDLHRNAGQPDQSFSERQIYESALDRLAAEYAALEQLEKPAAIEKLIAHLKSE
jgi:CarD family transcriptional regulator